MTHSNDIQVIGACENNLKHVTVSIPKGKLVAVFVNEEVDTLLYRQPTV